MRFLALSRTSEAKPAGLQAFRRFIIAALAGILEVSVEQPSFAQEEHRILGDSQLRELLHALREEYAQRPQRSYRFRSEILRLDGPESFPSSLSEIRRGEIRSTGDRLKWLHEDERLNVSSDEYELVRKEGYLWEDNRGIGYRAHQATIAFPDGEHTENFTTLVKLHEHVRPDMNGWFADGTLFGSSNYTEMLSSASDVNAVVERGDGDQLLIHIRSTTEFGKLEVWIQRDDPKLLRKARFEATSRFFEIAPDLTGALIEVEISEYIEVDGFYLPKEATALYTFQHTEAPTPLLKKLISTSRENYILGPDFDFDGAFDLNFAEDTVVTSQDPPFRSYIWKDNELRPHIVVDLEEAVDRMIEDLVPLLTQDTEVDESTAAPESITIPSPPPTKPTRSPWKIVALTLTLVAVSALVVLGLIRRRVR